MKHLQEISELSKILNVLTSRRIDRNAKLLELRRPFIQKLEKQICPKDEAKLIPVGSLPNGLAIDETSDLDLVFYSSNSHLANDFMNRSTIQRTINKFKKLSEEDIDFKLVSTPEFVQNRNFSLVIGKFKSGFSLDIQFANTNYMDWQTVRNTNMIKQYVSSDPRFPQLFYWLRRMFTQMGVKNSRCGLFSSYHILLLVIHFLQRIELRQENAVLPVLCHTHRYLLPQKIEEVIELLEQPYRPLPNWNSLCKKSVGELALELVDYWTNFDPYTQMVYIENGRTLNKKFIDNRGQKLMIFDPFHKEIVTRSSLLPRALDISFDFLRDRLFAGQYIDVFPELDGITEDFFEYARLKNVKNSTMKLNVENDELMPINYGSEMGWSNRNLTNNIIE